MILPKIWQRIRGTDAEIEDTSRRLFAVGLIASTAGLVLPAKTYIMPPTTREVAAVNGWDVPFDGRPVDPSRRAALYQGGASDYDISGAVLVAEQYSPNGGPISVDRRLLDPSKRTWLVTKGDGWSQMTLVRGSHDRRHRPLRH